MAARIACALREVSSPLRWAASLLACAGAVQAQPPGAAPAPAAAAVDAAASSPTSVRQLPEVVIQGTYDNAVGTTDAASGGTVTSRLIQSRPTLRPAEVLEFVPGVVVTPASIPTALGYLPRYFFGFISDEAGDLAMSLIRGAGMGLAVILVISGIVSLVRGQALWGVVLIVVGLLVGPGGVSIFT